MIVAHKYGRACRRWQAVGTTERQDRNLPGGERQRQTRRKPATQSHEA